jgi:large subunit ribosomal protein L7Ae
MSKKSYVKFQIPKEIADKAYQVLEIARDSGKLRKGTNESTKAVERGVAKLVLLAEDVDPPQVVAHLPILCEERKIAYLYVPSKEELGKSTGIDVPTAAVSIEDPGEAKDALNELIEAIKKQVEPATEKKPKEEKPEKEIKEEKPKEEMKPEKPVVTTAEKKPEDEKRKKAGES